MADVATGVLHNVGNVLNSVNISTTVIRKQFANSALASLEKASGLLSQYESSLSDFIREDVRGKQLPTYIIAVSHALRTEQNSMDREFDDLAKNVEHIKEIIAVQQTMAKASGMQQELSAREIIDDVMTANKESLINHSVAVVEELEEPDSIFVSDKHRILQILINLVRNAKEACVESKRRHSEIILRTWTDNDHVHFQIADNGVGISNDKIDKIFQHGFTTKKHGHGFGLHSSANAATELGGNLSVTSAGTDKGSRFLLRIPRDNHIDRDETGA